MPTNADSLPRDVLPIPDRQHVGVTTYDAKDPATSFPPIEPLRPPEGAPNVLVVLIDDAGFGSSSAFGGPCNTPNFERLAKNGLKYSRFHTTALCSPTRQALLTGRNHHAVGMGGITEIATSAPGYNSRPAEVGRPAGGDPEAERLLDRAVRQVPRGAGLGDEPDGPVRLVAVGRRRLRALLRLHRRRDEPVRAGHLPGHGPRRARPHRGGGLPLHGGHDRPRDRLDPPAEGAHARQAVLRLLRAGRHARAAPRPARVVGQVQGQVRPGLGRPARGDVRPPEGARRHPRRRGADGATGGDPRVGRDARRHEARLREADGGVRGLPRAHRPSRRTRDRRARGPRDPRRHADLRDRRRQRRLGRGHAQRLLQRAGRPERRVRARDGGVHDRAHRRLRHPQGLQPLRGRLGARDGHALPVDQAGRLALGRDAQRHDRPLARRDQGQGRDPQPVPPRDRRGGDRARRGRPAGADVRPRHPADAARTARRWPTRSTTPTRPSGARPSTSRCSATAASTTRAGPRSPATAHRGSRPRCRRSTTTSGSSTARTTGRRRTTSHRSSPRSSQSSSACS